MTHPGELGYVVSLTALEEPDDLEKFLELVRDGAHLIFLGPNDDQREPA